ncbi:MAG: hypothetical protein LBV69_06895 [Bacteroidales bacterium]|jgi:hypothetical protein|nr:hypothetical protein [Bacteroidales bacterium]
MNKFYCFFIIAILFSNTVLFSQNKDKIFMVDGIYSNSPINPEVFNNNLFQEIMIYKINNFMDSLKIEGFEINDFFVKTAKTHAEEMALLQEVSTEDIANRLITEGGSGVGTEFVAKITIRLSNEFISYDNLCTQILDRWTNGKLLKELTSQKYFFAGIFGKLDESGKKIYASMYIGNYNSLKTPSSVKAKGRLKPFDSKICIKATNKMPNVVDLQKGIEINENNDIIFSYNDLKKIKRLIKDSKDGLAVDIVETEKYQDCSSIEVPSDNTKITIGIPTKPIYTKKLYKNNLAEGEGKRNKITKLKVNLGKLPENFTNANNLEYNLIVVKGKRICADIPQSYINKKIYDFVPKITLLPDTIEPVASNKYVPVATSTKFDFKINFEQSKYNYNPEEMIPVIKALNEPDFIINKILIETFSSLEGTQNQNEELQKKRAQNIVKAFEANQNASIVDSIITAANFEDLKKDVINTEFEKVASMNFNEAVEYVNQHAKQMENILKNHRYANITIWVTYNADGDKEQDYVLKQFNNAVEAENLDLALSIQKYIIKRVVEDIYNSNAITDMKIPQGKKYVGLNMNKIWLTQFAFMEPLDEEYLEKINILNQLDNTNIYVEYNDIICETEMSDLKDENLQDNIQKRIDRLYNTSLAVNLVDLINIELQYQIMNNYKDSLDYNNPIMKKCLTKIKEIIHFDELSWNNSLKLATIFIVHNDYDYAAQLLEPFVLQENVPFEFISTYVTLCSKITDKFNSNHFVLAAQKIKEQNPDYFCNLFKGDKLSKQMFINTKMKDLYCKTCIKK